MKQAIETHVQQIGNLSLKKPEMKRAGGSFDRQSKGNL